MVVSVVIGTGTPHMLAGLVLTTGIRAAPANKPQYQKTGLDDLFLCTIMMIIKLGFPTCWVRKHLASWLVLSESPEIHSSDCIHTTTLLYKT